jgi:excinuclease UvrABC nuclease subunit
MDGQAALYVGMASNLLARIGGQHHKRDAKKRCTHVLLYRCETLNAANDLESLLIHALKPTLNINRKLHYANKLLGNSKYRQDLRS